MGENKATIDAATGVATSDQSYNYVMLTHQKRKEYPFFDNFTKRTRLETDAQSQSNDGNVASGSTENYPGHELRRSERGQEIAAPEEEMNQEMTETTEGIRKLTIEERKRKALEEQQKLNQQQSQYGDDCDGDLDSVSKAIPEGDGTEMTQEESESLAKPFQADHSAGFESPSSLQSPDSRQQSLVSDPNQGTSISSSRSWRNPVQTDPSGVLEDNQQRMGSTLAKPIPACESSVGSHPNLQSDSPSSLRSSDSVSLVSDPNLAKPIQRDQSSQLNPNPQCLPTSSASSASSLCSARCPVEAESMGQNAEQPRMPQTVPIFLGRQRIPVYVEINSQLSAAPSMVPQSYQSSPSFQQPIQAVSFGQNAAFQQTPPCQECMRRQIVKRVSTASQTDESSFMGHTQPADYPMMQQAQPVPVPLQQMSPQPVPNQMSPQPVPNMQQAVVQRQSSMSMVVQRSSSLGMDLCEDTEMVPSAAAPRSAPPVIVQSDNSAMFVSRTWGNDFGRSSIFNRFLAPLVSTFGMAVFTPVLQRNKHPVLRDDHSGVYKLHPIEEKLARLNHREPSIDWFYQHRSLYPYFNKLPNVRSIISYLSVGEDKGLIEAAKDFKQSLFPRAKLIYFNVAIPEDYGDTQGEAESLDNAQTADVVFSLGHQIYYHFENKYKALYEAHPRHLLYLPPLSEMFISTEVTPTEGKVQVLSVCNVTCEGDFHRYTLGAVAMGKLVNAYYHAYEHLPVWSVIGVDKSLLLEFEKFLQEKANSRQLRINVYSSKSMKEFRRSLLQSVLFIAPEKTDSFNFPAYLALQTGIPVLVPRCSGLFTFLERLFEFKDYANYFSVETGLRDSSLEQDGDRWRDIMVSRLNPSRKEIAFKRGQELKKDLKECQLFQQHHEVFLRELL